MVDCCSYSPCSSALVTLRRTCSVFFVANCQRAVGVAVSVSSKHPNGNAAHRHIAITIPIKKRSVRSRRIACLSTLDDNLLQKADIARVDQPPDQGL
jgi:hypothetical protein